MSSNRAIIWYSNRCSLIFFFRPTLISMSILCELEIQKMSLYTYIHRHTHAPHCDPIFISIQTIRTNLRYRYRLPCRCTKRREPHCSRNTIDTYISGKKPDIDREVSSPYTGRVQTSGFLPSCTNLPPIIPPAPMRAIPVTLQA